MNTSAQAHTAVLVKNLPYDPLKDFIAVAPLTSQPYEQTAQACDMAWFRQLSASRVVGHSVFVRGGLSRSRPVNSGGERFPQRTINSEVGLCVRVIRSHY